MTTRVKLSLITNNEIQANKIFETLLQELTHEDTCTSTTDLNKSCGILKLVEISPRNTFDGRIYTCDECGRMVVIKEK